MSKWEYHFSSKEYQVILDLGKKGVSGNPSKYFVVFLCREKDMTKSFKKFLREYKISHQIIDVDTDQLYVYIGNKD
jgi:hypothetical protein